MERKIDKFYQKWKNDIIRKPLILYGPKQIGKTFSAITLYISTQTIIKNYKISF